jgi:hypothetical protein
VGKTTLVMKLFESLRASQPHLSIRGFFTSTLESLLCHFSFWSLHSLLIISNLKFVLCCKGRLERVLTGLALKWWRLMENTGLLLLLKSPSRFLYFLLLNFGCQN